MSSPTPQHNHTPPHSEPSSEHAKAGGFFSFSFVRGGTQVQLRLQVSILIVAGIGGLAMLANIFAS